MGLKTIRNIVCFFLIFSSSLYAQTSKFERIELVEDEIKYYGCVPFGDKGLLLKTFDSKKQNNHRANTFTYIKYDTSFKALSFTDVSIPAKKSAYIDYTTKDKHYNFAYQTSGTYSVSIIDINNLKSQNIQGKFPKNTIINTIRATGDFIYFLGYTKDLPILLAQNITTGNCIFEKIIPLNKRKFSIISFEANEENNEAYLFTKDEIKNERIIKLYIYKDGDKTYETTIKSPDNDKYIVSAFASKSQDGSYFISGTYGNSTKHTESSVGIFISKLNQEGKIEFTKFINYLDIKNFTSYLSVRKQDRIEKKQEKLNSQNKELELNYLMVPHKIIENNGTHVLVGEAYYPTYRQECQHISGLNGQSMHCYQVFDGFQYTHFFVLGFDENGETLWTNSAPMYIEEKPFAITKFLSISKNLPNLQIIYSAWDKIFVCNYNNGENISIEEISYINEDEKLLTSTSKNRYWYGNKFISFGVQKIKSKENKAKREVFFIEKIEIPTK
ncbi:MAG: hypothetical protein MJ198_01270 [Bacteroidales bacterium]|nr:hypothetical protein [Bacteroidales bacterium]